MLGTRGCRLGILYPEIYEMQVEAIMRARRTAIGRGRRTLEIMIPLVDYEHELEIMRELVVRVGDEHGLDRGRGLHRRDDDRAARARASSPTGSPSTPTSSRSAPTTSRRPRWGSRATTSSRSSCRSTWSARSSTARRSRRSTSRASAGSCGWRRGSGARRSPELKLGICGEHGGDPDSIEFFHMAGLDYVSCSPFRVPIARVAAAQAAIIHANDRSWADAQALRRLRIRGSAAAAGQNGRVIAPPSLTTSPPRQQARGGAWLSPLAAPLVSGGPRARRRRTAALRTPFQRDRDRIVHSQGVPAAQAQDAGVRGARGRPLPDAAHAHAGGDADLAHGRAGAAAQRGPDGGDRARATTSATRRSATSARTCWTAAGASASGAASATTSTRCGWSTCSSALNLTEPVRDGILRHSSRRGRAGDAGGQDRPAGRPDRLHQPRHRRRGARRRARVGRPAGRRRSRSWGRPGRRGSTRSCTTSSSTPSAAGDIVQGEEVGRAMLRAALVHVRARLPRADARGPSTRRSSACCAGCSTGTASTRRSCPEAADGATPADRVIDYLAGMTDRFAIRAWTERVRAAGPARSDGALHARSRASASATRSTSRSSSARGPSCARPGVRRLQGLCPFHEERTPSFGIDPVEKLYHCFGCGAGGDVFTFVMETEGLDFGGALESLAERYAGRARARGRGPARRRAARAARPAARAAGAHRRVLRAGAVGVARGGGRARVPRAVAGSRRRAARVTASASRPSAWDRVLTASRRAGFTRGGAARRPGWSQRSRRRAG